MQVQQAASESAAENAKLELMQATRGHVSSEETQEINGPKKPEPTRYGDWERGRASRQFLTAAET